MMLNLFVNKQSGVMLEYSYKEDSKREIIKKSIDGHWIQNVDNLDGKPFDTSSSLRLLKCFVMNDSLRVQARWLDKYVYILPGKMFVSLAWSVLPKVNQVPFSSYIKKVEEEEEFKFIFDRIRKHFKMADNDFNAIKGRLLNAIKTNMIEWFSFYGIPKSYWKKYYLDFRLIKYFGTKNKPQKGLDAWGL